MARSSPVSCVSSESGSVGAKVGFGGIGRYLAPQFARGATEVHMAPRSYDQWRKCSDDAHRRIGITTELRNAGKEEHLGGNLRRARRADERRGSVGRRDRLALRSRS